MATPKKVPFLHEVEQQIRQLAGPLNVTLAKVANNKSTPYPMWVKQNGFTTDEVIAIGPSLLEWCGGGTSLLNILDVDGKSVQCQVYYPTDIYPEKVPPTMAHNLRQPAQQAPAQVIQLQQPQQQVVQPVYQAPMAAAASGGYVMNEFVPAPTGSIPGVPSGVSVRGQTIGQPQQQVPQQMQGWPASDPVVRVVERPRAEEDRIRVAEENAAREREARRDLEGKMERDRLEMAHQKQLEGMKEELRRVHEKSTAPDETVRAVVDMVKDLSNELRALKEAKKEDASTSLFAMMMQMQQQQQQQAQQQMAQLVAMMNSKPTGMDPTVQVLIESMRSDREAARERERSEREARREEALVRREEAREREKSAIGVREVLEMADKLRSSSGIDTIMRSMSDVFGTMTGMMKNQVETMQQLNGGPPPHPAVELIGSAMNGVQEMAKQYFNSKQTVEVAKEQVKAMEIRSRMQQAEQPPGAGQPAPAQGPAKDNVVPLRPVPPEAAVADPQTSMSPQEQQLFGVPVLMAKVEELRVEVAHGRVPPEKVVEFIRTAHMQLKHANLLQHVKVYGLYEQGLFDDFVRVLLPNAPQPFIIALVNILVRAAANPNEPIPVTVPVAKVPAPQAQAQAQAQEENDDEEDEDDDDL